MKDKFINHSIVRARNNEHYEFYKLFTDYFTSSVAETLEISDLYNSFIEIFKKEEGIISTLKKYEETAKIQELDHQRDDIYSYLVQDVKNKQRSPIEAEATAAKKIEPIFQQHSQVASETQLGESGALSYLLKFLKTDHSAEVAALGLTVTIDKLSEINEEFERLLVSRGDESQRRKDVSNMVNVRKELDQKHSELLSMLNGLWLVLSMKPNESSEKIALLEDLSVHLNSIITDLFNNLKERHKRNKAIEA